MTKVLEINCDKAWRIIGYSSWALITIGLGFSLWGGYDYYVNPHIIDQTKCDQDKAIDPNFNWYVCQKETDPSLYILAIIGNLINIGCIWYKINTKIKLVEIRCK